jgi:hypothetical protein
MDVIYDQLLQEYGAVSYEAFINLLVDITEDQTTPDQLRDAFRGIASDKVSQRPLSPIAKLIITFYSPLSLSSTFA